MKKFIKKNAINKLTLIILTITLLSIINPIHSNAGIGISTLTKPFSGMIMRTIDSCNALLATFFASDTKMESIAQTVQEIKDIDDSKGLFEKIAEGLDECQDGYYNLLLSPDDIFSNRVQATNANIFSKQFAEDGTISTSDFNLYNHVMKQLKQAVAKLYYIMRNLAIVILLSLLIYTGIRIVLSSTNAGEKAKWKMMLYDWLKALALVMFVHIIMIGVFYISEIITDGLQSTLMSDNTIVTEIRRNFDSTSVLDAWGNIVYIIMYGYITYLTIVFLISYFKRLFYIMTMIVVAPLVSSLYALGKVGKERFNRWFKEFVGGVMVQPFHMLIYSILVLIPMGIMNSSGITVGSGVLQIHYGTFDAQVYALIAISMIRPIEKYMRGIFGFGQTALDNVASFDSGKKTLDKGVQVIQETAKTAVMIGGAIATGGTSLAMTAGTTAATGAAAGAAGNTAATVGATTGTTAGTVASAATEVTAKATAESIAGAEATAGAETDIAKPEIVNQREPDNSAEGEEKPYIGGQNLSTMLLGKLGDGLIPGLKLFGENGENLSARLNLENLSESILLKPEMLEQYKKLRAAGHEMVDTYYIEGGAPKDWNTNITQEYIQDKKDSILAQFVSNEKNINDAIKEFGIDEKIDKQTGKHFTREEQVEQAKEKLKAMAPYAGLGITDVATIKNLMDRNVKPAKAFQTIAKDNKAFTKLENFKSEQNIRVMQNMIADKLGKSIEFNAGDQNVVQQVNQQVQQNISAGEEFIKSGAAKDPETLMRLNELQRKIDEKVTLGETEHHSRTQWVTAMDKIIEKAIKDNVKTIKLPVNKKLPINEAIKTSNSKAEKQSKIIEGIMNEALKERKAEAQKAPKRLN
ncbi:MAG: hypothetical protein ACI4UX_02965 [Clostridia bacterium]